MALDEDLVEETMYVILEAAEQNDWALVYFGPEERSKSKVLVPNFLWGKTEEEERLLCEAAYRLAHEKQWIRRQHQARYKVTESGRKALMNRKHQSDTMANKAPLLFEELSCAQGAIR